MKQIAGWTDSDEPTLRDFFFTRKDAAQSLLDKLTASPTAKGQVKPVIITGNLFRGKIQVCQQPKEIQNWAKIKLSDRTV